MKVYHCNIFDLADRADAICITTNGIIKTDGRAVMGKGIALEASKRFPGIDFTLAEHIIRHDNVPGIIWEQPRIVSFPTKYDWRNNSSLDLITRSARRLAAMIEANNWSKVAITKPGCANGNLQWSDVEPIIERYLPNIYVCDFN